MTTYPDARRVYLCAECAQPVVLHSTDGWEHHTQQQWDKVFCDEFDTGPRTVIAVEFGPLGDSWNYTPAMRVVGAADVRDETPPTASATSGSTDPETATRIVLSLLDRAATVAQTAWRAWRNRHQEWIDTYAHGDADAEAEFAVLRGHEQAQRQVEDRTRKVVREFGDTSGL